MRCLNTHALHGMGWIAYHTPMYYELTDHILVERPLNETWAFFCKAENLPRITPSKMNFTIVTPTPIDIGQDTLIDYRVSVNGIPVKWRTRIIDWSPPRQFIDLQLRGPYALWHHQHTFAAVEGGTECRDRVTYKVPGGPAGRVINRLMIRRQLTEIFSFRREAIAKLLGPVKALEEITIRKL